LRLIRQAKAERGSRQRHGREWEKCVKTCLEPRQLLEDYITAVQAEQLVKSYGENPTIGSRAGQSIPSEETGTGLDVKLALQTSTATDTARAQGKRMTKSTWKRSDSKFQILGEEDGGGSARHTGWRQVVCRLCCTKSGGISRVT